MPLNIPRKKLIKLLAIIATLAICYCQAECSMVIDTCCRPRLITNIEFLFWQTCTKDLDFAIRLKKENITPGSGTNCIRYKFTSPDFDGGLRGGIGIESLFSDWDLTASLTYLCANKSKTANAPTNGLALGTVNHGDFNLISNKVRGHYWLHYWESDYLLTNRYWLDRCYSLDPFFGIDWAIFDQNRQVKSTVTSGDETGDYSRFKWQGDYWGVGLKTGSEFSFHPSGSVRYFLRLSGSLLAGESTIKNKQKLRHKALTNSSSHLTFKTNECLIVPGYHILIGLHLHHLSCGKNYWFRCGYEFVNWHNLPSVRRFMNDGADIGISTSSSQSTIGFHGLFAGGGVSF